MHVGQLKGIGWESSKLRASMSLVSKQVSALGQTGRSNPAVEYNVAVFSVHSFVVRWQGRLRG